ncbi:MAG: hypothetical protein AAF821_05140 [Cyanobacteria bacterium P01_D01_bin.156]
MLLQLLANGDCKLGLVRCFDGQTWAVMEAVIFVGFVQVGDNDIHEKTPVLTGYKLSNIFQLKAFIEEL